MPFSECERNRRWWMATAVVGTCLGGALVAAANGGSYGTWYALIGAAGGVAYMVISCLGPREERPRQTGTPPVAAALAAEPDDPDPPPLKIRNSG